MAEASCRRELDLEIPAESNQATEGWRKSWRGLRGCRDFRPGKAPISLIKSASR